MTVDAAQMRQTLGRFTTGVTVVTTARGAEIHAMTANAFTSVSLEPPLVLVSIDKRTRMHALLPGTRRFGVSVLGSDQERTAWHFAGHPLAEPGELFEWAADVPFVRGAIAQVACSLHAEHPAGDHTLYLGLVDHLDRRPGDPLLFHGGTFGRISPEEELGLYSSSVTGPRRSRSAS